MPCRRRRGRFGWRHGSGERRHEPGRGHLLVVRHYLGFVFGIEVEPGGDPLLRDALERGVEGTAFAMRSFWMVSSASASFFSFEVTFV
jgi:hypothetical protein